MEPPRIPGRFRERYFIYRVTHAHNAIPTITRYCDPLRLVRLGHAELRLSGARLAFHDGADTSEIQSET